MQLLDRSDVLQVPYDIVCAAGGTRAYVVRRGEHTGGGLRRKLLAAVPQRPAEGAPSDGERAAGGARALSGV